MPNGHINRVVLANAFRNAGAQVDTAGLDSWDINSLSDLLGTLSSTLVKMANQDLDEVAFGVVEEDAETAVSMRNFHKIQNIKRVRELTGCGLKEAKEA